MLIFFLLRSYKTFFLQTMTQFRSSLTSSAVDNLIPKIFNEVKPHHVTVFTDARKSKSTSNIYQYERIILIKRVPIK